MKSKIMHTVLVFAASSMLAADEANQALLKLDDPWAALREKDWSAHPAIAVGDSYAITFLTKPAGGPLAEYYQRAFLFGGTERNGRFLQAFQLRMNTGGRTHVLLCRQVDETGRLQFLTFQDRYGSQTSNLVTRTFHPDRAALPAKLKKEYLGTFSGEALPDKFYSPVVLPELKAQEKLK